MMDRSSKLRKLDGWRRNLPFCSAAALAAVLESVTKDGVPDLGHDRKNIREARNEMTLETETPYGCILQHTEMLMPDDVPKQVPVAHPLAMLYEAVSKCLSFSTFFLDRLREQMPTPTRPWNVVLYTDEVTRKESRPGEEIWGPPCGNQRLREVFEPWLWAHGWILQSRSGWHEHM